ncbi:hypothetical protein V8C86DRAFT_2684366 [Haematococcus lacustris]
MMPECFLGPPSLSALLLMMLSPPAADPAPQRARLPAVCRSKRHQGSAMPPPESPLECCLHNRVAHRCQTRLPWLPLSEVRCSQASSATSCSRPAMQLLN